jgi:hypothetical protein
MKWNHILVEGFCAKDWDYNQRHSKYHYAWDPEKDGGNFLDNARKVPNEKYDPKAKKPRRPKYCQKRVCIECIKCKHLAYCDVDDDFLHRFKEMSKKYFEETE